MWLQRTYDVSIPPKISRTSVPPKFLPPRIPKQAWNLLKAIRSAVHVQKLTTPHWGQTRSLTRRCMLVGLHWDADMGSLQELVTSLKEKLAEEIRGLHESLLKQWRDKVRTWTLPSRQLHAYVKNDPPPKLLVVNADSNVTNHPSRVVKALNLFWQKVETWPRNLTDDEVWEGVEDRFAIYLPHVPCWVQMTGAMLASLAKVMKKGTHGCDSWTIREIQKLPEAAWSDFLRLYTSVWPRNPPELLILKRRTPIEKNRTGVPDPGQVRPIDVFSTLLRLVSTCLCALLRIWLRQVTHDSQTATHGGILHSVTALAFWTECTLNCVMPVYAVSLDLSMMFNMLSPKVAGKLAEVAGLHEDVVDLLTWPLCHSKSVWKLPGNMVNPVVQAQRGLPQGMASSVLLAELVIACLVRKIHWCAHCHTIVYVDDINVVAFSLEDLRRCLEVVIDFVHTFCLSLSIMKSVLWGTDHDGLKQLEDAFGIQLVHTLEAFGATWQLRQNSNTEYKKEGNRILKVRERLLRVQHLPAHPSIRAMVTSSTALSPLDYLSLPNKKPLHSLRMQVRAAIGVKHGAPEIAFNLPTSAMLDPVDRGFISLLRVWIHAYNIPTYRQVLESGVFAASQGRLSALLKECAQRGVAIEGDTIRFGSHDSAPSYRLWAGWQAIRKHVVTSLKDLQFRALQERRPNKFAGHIRCAWKTMRREYARRSAYEAGVLMRIWTGSVMNAAHRHTITPEESPMCRCGFGEETLLHMMWDCPIHVAHRPDSLSWWASLPPACAMSLILPLDESRAFIADWRKVCSWAIMCVSKRSVDPVPDSPLPSDHSLEALPSEQNGHLVIQRKDLGYVWCARCHIARRARDAQFLTLKPCKRAHECPVPEGHYRIQEKHIVRIEMHTWKLHSWRPKACCVICGAAQWATATFKRPCPGE